MVSPLTSPPAFFQTGPQSLQAYADAQAGAANGFLLTLGDAAAGLTPPVIEADLPNNPTTPALAAITPPTLGTVVWTAPNLPGEFTESLSISDNIPDFTASAPEISIPTAPTFTDPGMPAEPAIDTSYSLPDLSISLPAPPALLSISVQPFDGTTMPTFDADAPELLLVSPSIREYVPGTQYTSGLLTALQTTLEERITNGGTGLGASGEAAIWDRGREREARSATEALAQLERMEQLGYMAPPGVYFDARLKITTEMDYASRGHSREVMAKSAELELDNVKHALTTAVALEGNLLNYTNQVEQRVFESCKYATEAGIAIYNAEVQAYGIRVEAYKTRAQVFEALVRAEMSKVEAYRAEIQAEQVKAQVNSALVDQYKAQVDAALSNVEVFKARVAAIQTKAELERNKILVFGEQVKAYGVRVSAFSSEVEAFRARIQGESAKQEAYGAAARAFSARVDGAAKIIDARIEAYKGQVAAYQARWEGYRAAAQGESARVQGLTAIETARAEMYRAQVGATGTFNEVLTKQWQAVLEQSARTAEIGVAAAKANGDLYMTTRSLALDAAKVGAQVSAQLGASALSTLHWSASYSEGRSDSTSDAESASTAQTVSNSVSTSTSTSTNYNYNV